MGAILYVGTFGIGYHVAMPIQDDDRDADAAHGYGSAMGMNMVAYQDF
jgi:hypothetical protein